MDPSRVIRKRAFFCPQTPAAPPKAGWKGRLSRFAARKSGRKGRLCHSAVRKSGKKVGFAASPCETPGAKVGFAASPRRSPGRKVGFRASTWRSPCGKVGFRASTWRSPDPRGRSDLCVPWEGDRRPLSREIPRNSGPGGLQKKFQNLRKNILTFFDFRL